MEVDGPPAAAEANGFDLEAYISNYSSHTKIDRLEFIADKCAGTPLGLEALRQAIDELKQGQNSNRYVKIVDKAKGQLGSDYKYDESWVELTNRRAIQTQEQLETMLSGYKANLVKESIRMGHIDLGNFHYERGDLQAAFKCYVRTRDYCTTAKHVLSMCLDIIKVSLENNNSVHASSYIQKAEQTPELLDQVVIAKLRCASGLVALASKKYKQAARKFVEVPVELGSNYSELFSAQDVAVYGGLCALASFDRNELIQHVINNIPFLEFLELVPEVRELVHDYYHSRYASCHKHMQALRPSLQLDIHLCDHVDHLYKEIRNRALIQYTAPFTSVDLAAMAAAFSTTVEGLEEELASLIMDNQIQARIDSHKKLLYARRADARAGTFQRILSAGTHYERDVKSLLLRTNLRKHDFVLRPKNQPKGAGFWGHHEDT